MKIKYIFTHVRNNKFKLIFLVPPTIDPMTDIIANAGDKVDLECVAVGTPPPTLEWYYRGSFYASQRVIFKNVTLRKFIYKL